MLFVAAVVIVMWISRYTWVRMSFKARITIVCNLYNYSLLCGHPQTINISQSLQQISDLQFKKYFFH